MAKVQYKTIPPDVIIDIQVSGSFYRRLVELLTSLGNAMKPEDFKAVLEKLKTNDPPANLHELNIHINMMLIYEIEQQALKQNKVKDAEVEVPDEEKPVEVTGS
jgi:hypothetical protein